MRHQFRFASLLRSTFSLALSVLCLTVFNAPNAQAYFSTIDDGELVAPGQYQVSVEPQVLFDRYPGVNGVARFDTGFNDSSSVRGILGFGKVDFQLGGMYKWIPFPDVDGQPAIGLDAGMILARVNNQNEFSVRLHPLISKRFETEIGDLIPYGSLPLGVTTRPDKTVIPVQIVAGTEFRPLNLKNFSFFGELGINLNEAFSYISAAVAYRFDDGTLRGSGNKK
jgi:hypothetical protein